MKKLAKLIFLATLLPVLSHAVENPGHQSGEGRSGVAALSPELRALFAREMVELQNGMMALTPLYVSGNLGEIAVVAGQMEDSYVLKKNLSQSQMHELHSKLPGAFIEQDQEFHYLAGMLEHVANVGKTELVGFYISRMTEACVKCHSEYATHRFPALAPKKQDEHDH